VIGNHLQGGILIGIVDVHRGDGKRFNVRSFSQIVKAAEKE